jgi:hypothetical protein
MRLDLPGDGCVIVTLSRRNLFALLARLERGVPGAIVSENAYLHGTPVDGISFAVRPEPDERHYDREPGPMLPETEALIRWAEARATADEAGREGDANAE